MSDYFTALERELVAAARREAATAATPAPPPRSGRRRGGRALLVAIVALVVGVPATAAVRDAFTPAREPDGITRLSPDTVVARGVLPVRGRWEMVASDSDVGRCLGIRFRDDPGGGGLGGGCGPRSGARFVVGSSGGGSARLPHVSWGVAPAAARHVRLVVDDGRFIAQAPTHPGPAAAPGGYFAVESGSRRPRACLQAVDDAGRVLAEADLGTLEPPCHHERRRG